jgi:hypothetical protein
MTSMPIPAGGFDGQPQQPQQPRQPQGGFGGGYQPTRQRFNPMPQQQQGFGGFGGFGGGFGMPQQQQGFGGFGMPQQQGFGGFGGYGMPQQGFGGFGGFGGGFGMPQQQGFGGFGGGFGMPQQQGFGGFGGFGMPQQRGFGQMQQPMVQPRQQEPNTGQRSPLTSAMMDTGRMAAQAQANPNTPQAPQAPQTQSDSLLQRYRLAQQQPTGQEGFGQQAPSNPNMQQMQQEDPRMQVARYMQRMAGMF